jgi:hypothetical protein
MWNLVVQGCVSVIFFLAFLYEFPFGYLFKCLLHVDTTDFWKMTPCTLITFTGVSEKRTVSIFKVEEKS